MSNHQNIQNQDMSLVLSSDAKPRLKWTPELHQRFVDAVTQLGGPEKATPKSLMRMMGIHGLTLYHLKSHLQKYRLGKSQQSPAHSETKDEEFLEKPRSDLKKIEYDDGNPNQMNESLKIAQALQMQMEVQRKLHEQIEVQRHLQLRIEAQGKYLQSVLRKAQDTLAGYNSSAIEVEIAKAELSQLVSMMDQGCPSSSLSVLTEMEDHSFKTDIQNKPTKAMVGSSLESSLTSSESSERKEDTAAVLSLIEMNPGEMSRKNNNGNGRKRNGSTISDGNCLECQPTQGKRTQRDTKSFDLNSQYVSDYELGSTTLDLNCN